MITKKQFESIYKEHDFKLLNDFSLQMKELPNLIKYSMKASKDATWDACSKFEVNETESIKKMIAIHEGVIFTEIYKRYVEFWVKIYDEINKSYEQEQDDKANA